MSTERIRHVVEISSNIGRGCEHCDESIGGGFGDGEISGSINHYIQAHGYQLLHVGTETIHDTNGKPWHTTVAIVGHGDPPAKRPPVQVIFGGTEPPDLS